MARSLGWFPQTRYLLRICVVLQLVIATKNNGKIKELKELAGSSNWLELLPAPDQFDPVEDGKTFVENAIIKAQAASELTSKLACADDSGLEIESLDNWPGIYSARVCSGTDAQRRQVVIEKIETLPGRLSKAAFVCAMAVYMPGKGVIFTTQARWSGYVREKEKGNNGFGYDPIFYLDEKGNTTAAELSSAEKNLISHRGQAWRKVLTFLCSLEV